MEIRKYHPSDCRELTELFYHTVHTVNAKDYTEEHASVTAKGFFEKRGYRVIKEQQAERHGILLTNYVMEKRLKA